MAISVPAVPPKSMLMKPVPRSSAVVWIDDGEAIIARTEKSGVISTRRVERDSEPTTIYLATVVDEIGDRERILITGPGSARLALEREYTAIYQRPDRLVDVEPSEAMDEAGLIERLDQLAT